MTQFTFPRVESQSLTRRIPGSSQINSAGTVSQINFNRPSGQN